MDDAPIELLAYNEPHAGLIRARREGEASFTHVQSIGDAYMAAQVRNVQVVISEHLVEELRNAGELPPDLPSWIEVSREE